MCRNVVAEDDDDDDDNDDNNRAPPRHGEEREMGRDGKKRQEKGNIKRR